MPVKRRRPSSATPWAGAHTVLPAEIFHRAVGTKAKVAHAAPSVAEEVQRMRSLAGLRQTLIDACRSGSVARYPSMAFERWWYSVRGAIGQDDDPLLPGRARSDDPVLVGDLMQVGFSRNEANRIAQQLAVAAGRAASRRCKPLSAGVAVNRLAEGSVELSCAAVGAVVQLPAQAFKKLRTLHTLHSGAEGSSHFPAAALVMVLRYQSLGGAGFQLALPSASFEVLVSHFGVCAECFASPLNCWFGRYCSAFFDSDAPFGSLGSFCDFRPSRGAFEANPPFAPAVLSSMREHIHNLLAAAVEPLSFVIAVAHWEHPEVHALLASPFMQAHTQVPQEEQCWLDGAEKRRAPVELLLLVLQNAAATADAHFAATAEKLEVLRRSCTGEAKPLGPRKKPSKPGKLHLHIFSSPGR